MDADRQRELMIKVDYDPRASGGFFGGSRTSLRRDPQTDRRYLTEAGRRLLRRGRDEYKSLIDP